MWEKRSQQAMSMQQFTDYLKKNSLTVDSDTLKEDTYFKCIKYISESIAKIPIYLKCESKQGEVDAKDHVLYDRLRLRPNPSMSAVDCIKTFVALAEHRGVSGLLIDRKNMYLYPVEVSQIIVDDIGLIASNKNNKVLVYWVGTNGETGTCLEKDIILFKSGITFDGINAHANAEYLQSIIQTNQKSQSYLSNLFDNGLTNKILVQMTSDIKDDKELGKVQQRFDKLYSSDGRTFTVPAGFNVSTLNLSLADAQFEQLRKLSRREIANAFGLAPSQIGDLSDSNNNNMEMQNLSYLVDTLLIKFEQIEQELDYKLLTDKERKQGYKFRFNTNVMLRTNAEGQADILTKYIQNGVYTTNDVRGILGFTKVEEGNDITVSSGVYKLKDLSKIVDSNNNKGGEKNGEQAKGI